MIVEQHKKFRLITGVLDWHFIEKKTFFGWKIYTKEKYDHKNKEEVEAVFRKLIR